MKVSAWGCLLIAGVIGCNNVDRRYEPPSIGPMAGHPTAGTAGTPAAWQSQGRLPPIAHRGSTAGLGFQELPTSTSASRPASGLPTSPQGLALIGRTPLPPSGGAWSPTPEPVADARRPGFDPADQTRPIIPATAEAPPEGGATKRRALRPVTTEPEGEPAVPRPLPPVAGKNPALEPAAPEGPPPALPPAPAAPPPAPAADAPEVKPPAAPPPALPVSVVEEKPTVEEPKPLPETAATAPAAPPVPPVVATGAAEKSVPAVASPPAPAVRMVNSKRIVLNYQVKDVGPSGVASVDLYTTRDGRSWRKEDTTAKSAPPYVIEVTDEGLYGFTLVAKSGVGLGRKPPESGDLPQVWVEVDLTKPVVSAAEVKHGPGTNCRDVVITWNAQDKNLARRPITLSYSEKPEGPWLPLAANIENSGKHHWRIPDNSPPKFLVRVEAIDLVGNIGVAQTAQPILVDISQPTVSIIGVEPADH